MNLSGFLKFKIDTDILNRLEEEFMEVDPSIRNPSEDLFKPKVISDKREQLSELKETLEQVQEEFQEELLLKVQLSLKSPNLLEAWKSLRLEILMINKSLMKTWRYLIIDDKNQL